MPAESNQVNRRRLAATCLTIHIPYTEEKNRMKNDIFANIAAAGIGGRQELLSRPEPVPFEPNNAVLTAGGEAYGVSEKMHTEEQLRAALAELRERYAPFTEDLAPECRSSKEIIPLGEFTLYEEDSDPKQITLPHYGAPVGCHEQLYDTRFALRPEQTQGKAVYICIGGADYLASVYVNGVCVGIHEGFFSPFEFEITDYVNAGLNELRIQLKNDHVFMGSKGQDGISYEGEKMYAATGPGWDDPAVGWHHCQPGMGLYSDVRIEVRERLHISDLWIRPDIGSSEAELWVEVQSSEYGEFPVELDISVYGQNHRATVVENMYYQPTAVRMCGLGDTFTAAQGPDGFGRGTPIPAEHGKNLYKVRIPMGEFLLWEPETPYLYQAQVALIYGGAVIDRASAQFGMRSFTEDTEPDEAGLRGMFRLNGRPIRLRGANTMGFEQQDVMRGDIDQLRDDILLAKLCNMNFLRLTQRPVQDEIYKWCDRLGLMTQTDLPLFAKMRRFKFAEGVRQAQELARMIRGHACNVVVSYMNEPTPGAGGKPHRHLTRPELEDFFSACDLALKLCHPDCVIKYVDGDYDPPCASLPDNHCYCMWYNGHGIDIGQLWRGYWLPTKPGWYYGCGEFGTEGLEQESVMRKYYPAEWLTEPFDPAHIVGAQTAPFHYFFYDDQDSMGDWIEASQRFQALGVRAMTESFRRDNRMISGALHLFIDAFPSGWMKTIMDCERHPKKAFFAYRDALAPIMLSLRTDRFTYYEGEDISIEAHICNDTQLSGDCRVRFELYRAGELAYSGEQKAYMAANCAGYAASAVMPAPETSDRDKYTLRGILIDGDGKALAWNELPLEVFRHVEITPSENTRLITMLTEDTVIAGETVHVKACGMSPVHFASRKTGHPSVAEFEPEDIRYFYDSSEDMITPIVTHTFECDAFTPILVGGNTDSDGNWHKVMIAGELIRDGIRYVVCNVDLRLENPIAERLKAALVK